MFLKSKRLFVAAVLVLSVGLAQAAEKVRFGFEGGASVATLNPPGGITATSIVGFTGGTMVEFPLGPTFSVQPELIFVQRGADLAGGGSSGASEHYDSIEVPVFFKAQFGSGDVQPNTFIGPYVGFRLTHNPQGTMGTINFNPQTMDFGFSGGVGVNLGAFFVNVRYVLGILNINQTSASWQTRGFLGMVGVLF